MNRPSEPEELRELENLPRTVEPPSELEDRVVVALESRGLIRQPSRGGVPRWWVAAACVVAAFVGWTARGVVSTPSDVAPETGGVAPSGSYLILLTEPEPLRTTKPMTALVEEYSRWAGELIAENRLVSAGRLSGDNRLLSAHTVSRLGPEMEGNLGPATGFFIVRASNLEEAVGIAQTCPHIDYGGKITVRSIAGRDEPEEERG